MVRNLTYHRKSIFHFNLAGTMIIKTFDGIDVPSLGFGTWQLTGETCKKAIHHALDIGYRHLDTAQLYDNEQAVGQALFETGISRDEVFLTTKLRQDRLSCEEVLRSFGESLSKLKTDYCDLLLIHWPSENVLMEETLEAMKMLKADGKIRAIGVSNFTPRLLNKALRTANLMCHQVEYNPFHNQQELLSLAKENDLMLSAYSPLAKGEVMHASLIRKIAAKYNKTPAQISLRWLIQQDNVVAIPKAADPVHRENNFKIFDFELTEDDMNALSTLNRKEGINTRQKAQEMKVS